MAHWCCVCGQKGMGKLLCMNPSELNKRLGQISNLISMVQREQSFRQPPTMMTSSRYESNSKRKALNSNPWNEHECENLLINQICKCNILPFIWRIESNRTSQFYDRCHRMRSYDLWLANWSIAFPFVSFQEQNTSTFDDECTEICKSNASKCTRFDVEKLMNGNSMDSFWFRMTRIGFHRYFDGVALVNRWMRTVWWQSIRQIMGTTWSQLRVRCGFFTGQLTSNSIHSRSPSKFFPRYTLLNTIRESNYPQSSPSPDLNDDFSDAFRNAMQKNPVALAPTHIEQRLHEIQRSLTSKRGWLKFACGWTRWTNTCLANQRHFPTKVCSTMCLPKAPFECLAPNAISTLLIEQQIE